MVEIIPIIERVHPAGRGGTQKIYRFPNGYGASVIQYPGSYGYDDGLWELAVLKFRDKDSWSITYDTPITDDVIGYLSEVEVQDILAKIEALEPDKTERLKDAGLWMQKCNVRY